jgi:hypothetical protein
MRLVSATGNKMVDCLQNAVLVRVFKDSIPQFFEKLIRRIQPIKPLHELVGRLALT